MNAETFVVANIALDPTQATELTFHDLATWVIWQFPRKKGGGLCGAVRPPIPQHGWYPAIILPKEKRVQVLAHLHATYPTPEEAGDITLQ
jgi:hypothetical protein